MILVSVLIGFLTLSTVIVIYFKWAFNYWKRNGVYSPPVKIPFGNIADSFFQKVQIGVDIQNQYNHCKNKNLKYAGIYLMSRPVFMPIDLELTKIIMTRDFQHFTDHGNYVNEKADPINAHIFSLKGLKWRNIRIKVTPTFTAVKMKMLFPTVLACSDELVNIIDTACKDKKSIEIKDIVGRYTTDVIGSCGFGIECNSLKNPDSKFRKYGKKIFEADTVQLFKSFMSFWFPKVLEFLNVPYIKRDVSSFFMNMVAETVNYREENNITRKDFMHLLIQLKNNINISNENENNLKSKSGEQGLTIPEIAAQAFIFFAAGFETTSTALTFFLYEMVKNLDIQEKLREEVIHVLEKHDGKLNYDAIMEMTFMDRCLQETLRIYPPISFLIRECTKAYRVPESNVTIEPGTLVTMSVLGIHHDPDNYTEPSKFDPDRFLPENKAQQHPFSWLPFGEGPRMCLGIRFGFMKIKIALAVLIKSYKFTLNSKTEQPLVLDPTSFTVSARGGVWLNVEKY